MKPTYRRQQMQNSFTQTLVKCFFQDHLISKSIHKLYLRMVMLFKNVPQKLIALEMLQCFCKWECCRKVIFVAPAFYLKVFNSWIINSDKSAIGDLFCKIDNFCSVIILEDRINKNGFSFFLLLILKLFLIPDNLFCFH